jgi:hypothetical protein
MDVLSEHHEDPDLKAMFDAGEQVSYAGETISFIEGNRTLVFTIDTLSPNEALFSKIITDGRRQSVKLGQSFGSSVVQLKEGDGLVLQAIDYLVKNRAVKVIAVYDGPSGFYKRVPPGELV